MRLLIVATLAAVCAQQAYQGPARSEAPVRGLYNWIHSTGDAERSFSFYRDVFGIGLARSPFAGSASRPFGRFVFAIDPDGVLVEFVEPSTSAP